jgi:hypothetical protein
VHGLDKLGALWIIPERFAQFTNTYGQSRLAHGECRPDGLEEFFFGYQAMRMLDEIAQHSKSFRSQSALLCPVPELLGMQVDPIGSEPLLAH